MAQDNFYVVIMPQKTTPDEDEAKLRGVAFVKKLGQSAQFRVISGQLHLFLRAPQTLQQMRTAVSGKLKPLGFVCRLSQVSEEEFAQQLAAAGLPTDRFANSQIRKFCECVCARVQSLLKYIKLSSLLCKALHQSA